MLKGQESSIILRIPAGGSTSAVAPGKKKGKSITFDTKETIT